MACGLGSNFVFKHGLFSISLYVVCIKHIIMRYLRDFPAELAVLIEVKLSLCFPRTDMMFRNLINYLITF